MTITVSVFHVYVHQFCYQLVFHPWKCIGFGKSNGEGNECIWSLCVDTIAPKQIMNVCYRISPLKPEHLCLKTVACKAYQYTRLKIRTHQFEQLRLVVQLGSCQAAIH